MRFSLKSLTIGVTLASIYLGAVTFLVKLDGKTNLPIPMKMILVEISLLIMCCVPVSLLGAFVGSRSGRSKQVALFAAVATAIAILATYGFHSP